MPVTRNGRQQVAAEGQQVAQTASQHGQEVVATASGQAKEVAGVVREQATQLTQELSSQGRELYQETRRQVQDQAQTQTEGLAQALHRWGWETQALVDGRPEDAGAVGECARQAADKLHELASEIEIRGVSGLAEELQDLGRRRPGAFLLGAAMIGFGGARLVRSGKSASEEDPEMMSDGVTPLPPAVRQPRSSAGRGASPVATGSTRRRNPASTGGE